MYVRYIGGKKLSSDEIKRQYGNMKQAAKKIIPNIECMLYQTLLKMGENRSLGKVLEKLNPDLIVVDEMHHIKTKRNDIVEEDEENNHVKKENEWGKKIEELIERYPQAKVIGLSATPIRSDNVNVVERLFQNKVASEISLLEAIESGIIMPPRYVTPDFVREDEIKTLLERIEETQGEEKSQAVVIDLGNNNEILYKSQGLDEIYQYEIRDIEALESAIEWIKENGGIPRKENNSDFKGKLVIKRLAIIKEKYSKYIIDPELLENLSKERQDEIKEIIEKGKEIDLWHLDLEVDKEDEKLNQEIDAFLEDITIKGTRRELKEILQEARDNSIPVYLQNARKIEEWIKK